MFTFFGKINECVTVVYPLVFISKKVYLYWKIINAFTYLVFEFLLTPIPLFKQLFIDSTGDVVIASNDIDIVEWT